MDGIALLGKMRSGKDTAGAYLEDFYGYTRLAFADPLKDLALRADPVIPYDLPGFGGLNHVRLSTLVEHIGWDRAKEEYPEVRRTLQTIGQGVRELDPSFWVRHLIRRAADAPGPVVVTDVRYPNEADALRANGLRLVRIVRPYPHTITETNIDIVRHESETALDGYPVDAEVHNTGTLQAFLARLELVL